MGILSRLRDTGEAFIAKRLHGAAPGASVGGFESSNGRRPTALSFSAEIPGSSGPLWQLRVSVQSEPQADGEQLRLRAHWRLALRRTLAAPDKTSAQFEAPGASAGDFASSNRRRPALPARVGLWIEKRLASPLVQSLTAPLLDRDISTWLELRTSDAALDDGSKTLVPERLSVLGIQPRPDRPVQTWAGELGGAKPGYAVLTLLQLDKNQLPPSLQKSLGPKPFQLAATIASVIEDAQSS